MRITTIDPLYYDRTRPMSPRPACGSKLLRMQAKKSCSPVGNDHRADVA